MLLSPVKRVAAPRVLITTGRFTMTLQKEILRLARSVLYPLRFAEIVRLPLQFEYTKDGSCNEKIPVMFWPEE